MGVVRGRRGAVWLLPGLLVLGLLQGCTVRLHPEYEPTIVNGLNELNIEGLSFFVSLDCLPDDIDESSFLDLANSCTDADTFDARKKAYDDLIGQAQAVIALVEYRPEPAPLMSRLFGSGLEQPARQQVEAKLQTADDATNVGTLVRGQTSDALMKAFDAPTDDAMKTLIVFLQRMRAEDKEEGLKVGDAVAHYRAFTVAMRNALTFEMALDR